MFARAACLFLLLSGCALRPRYGDLTTRFVAPETTPAEVQIQVLDRNDVPVPGARIEIGDRVRFKTLTDQDGVFRLPIEKKYADENALVVVVLPKGVRGYQLVAPGEKPGAPPPTPPPAAPSEIEVAADAGVTTM
ncbi:MAG: hypothetical protein JNK82_13730 [Myxococcaceae bacterium]|nr:hypothetical protein [Myxococcaceae bacterium]